MKAHTIDKARPMLAFSRGTVEVPNFLCAKTISGEFLRCHAKHYKEALIRKPPAQQRPAPPSSDWRAQTSTPCPSCRACIRTRTILFATTTRGSCSRQTRVAASSSARAFAPAFDEEISPLAASWPRIGWFWAIAAFMVVALTSPLAPRLCTTMSGSKNRSKITEETAEAARLTPQPQNHTQWFFAPPWGRIPASPRQFCLSPRKPRQRETPRHWKDHNREVLRPRDQEIPLLCRVRRCVAAWHRALPIFIRTPTRPILLPLQFWPPIKFADPDVHNKLLSGTRKRR